MTPKRCFKWGAIALAIFVVYGALMPALTGPRIREIVDYSILLFLLMFMMACSWRAMKLKTKARYFALLFLIYGLLNSLMFLHQILQ